MGERRAVIRQAAAGYHKADKKRKGQWLDELVTLASYHRWYCGARVRLVADAGLKARRGRQPVYDASMLKGRKKKNLKPFWA